MRKNLLDNKVAEEIITRANALKETDRPQWGTMTATEMLHHCNRVLNATMLGEASDKKRTFKQFILKFIFVKIMPRFPKGAKAPGRFDLKKNPASVIDFEKEKSEFVEMIRQFARNEKEFNVHHPIFGNLSNKEWGLFTWMHMDHHLRQFGV